MIASLSFQLSWGCLVGLPILTSYLGGIQVVRHPEGSRFLCEDSKFGRQRTTWSLDHKLLSQNKFTMPLGKTVLQQPRQKRHVPFTCICHVEVTLCKLLTYTSPSLSQMVKHRYINASLTISSPQGPLRTPRGIHPLMQGISFTTSSLQF